MKAEVLLPLALLALGLAVWSWSPPTYREPISAALRSPGTDSTLDEQDDREARTDNSAATPLQILEESIAALRQSEPLVAQVKLQIHLLDREFLGSGQYCQAGSGQPQTRWDLTLDGSGGNLFLSQIFDGRFFYRLEIQGQAKTLTYANLSEARKYPAAAVQGIASPSGWFGTGSLATMLEQLHASFEFEPAIQTQPIGGSDAASIEMLTLRGRWSRAGLRQLLRDQIAPDVLHPQIRWEQLPGQLPHAVELSLGSDEYLQRFPYQLTFFQFVRAGGDRYEPRPIFKLQLHQVEKKTEIAAEQFRVSADDLTPIDVTREYLERIRMFLQYPLRD